jgi:hypothetical protein
VVQSNRFHTNSARTEQGRTDLLDHIRGRGWGRDDAAFLRRSPPAVGSSPLGTYACSTWRTEQNLDVLRVDDQISSGQHAEVWSTCHRLADAARRWWTELEAIVYRLGQFRLLHSRRVRRRVVWVLEDRADILTDLVLRHRFTVDWDIGGA